MQLFNGLEIPWSVNTSQSKYHATTKQPQTISSAHFVQYTNTLEVQLILAESIFFNIC